MEHCAITLRAIRDGDQPRMLEILTDTTVNKTYMLPDFACKEDAIPLFNRLKTLSENPDRFVRAIVAGEKVVGFLNDVETTDSFIELGYVIHPDSHGRGYMTAALGTAIQALFEKGHPQVICGAFEHNLASIRVMEKAGMTRLEKTDEIEYRGKVHHCIYYGISKLKYKCLAIDHDDTVVQSEATINHPCFCKFLEIYRPGVTYSLAQYVNDCSTMPFGQMCKERFGITDEELYQEYLFWKAYMKEHIPDPFPGIGEVLQEYQQAGGKICVVSMSTEENIRRDYAAHFGFAPDRIYGCDLPEELRKPSTYPLEQICKEYGVSPSEVLVVDDMKFAVEMAHKAGCPIAFAGWSRKDYPNICAEIENICDFSFYSTEDFRNFLFD